MRLFTNVSYVTVATGGRPVRMNCSALAPEEPNPELDESFLSGGHRIRGFGPDPAWPVFTLPLECEVSEHETADVRGNLVMLRDDGEDVTLNGGVVLTFKDGTVVRLEVENFSRPIQVDDFEPGDYTAGMWPKLTERTREFWNAPYMPHLAWGPPAR